MSAFMKLKVNQITLDARYQRELDQNRSSSMSKHIDSDRIGVPVISRRRDGMCVVLDGQHRVRALEMAGKGNEQILCEVHSDLSLVEEAQLFLKLNSGRKAVRIYDKWRAQVVAKEATTLEIEKIVTGLGLHISKTQSRNGICAISSAVAVHNKYKNLHTTLSVLKSWADGDPGAYEGELIKGVGVFLATYQKEVDPKKLVKQLETYSPERVCARILRTTSRSDSIPSRDAAIIVLREIYNHRSKIKLMPLHQVRESAA